jgi:hypothetical protein
MGADFGIPGVLDAAEPVGIADVLPPLSPGLYVTTIESAARIAITATATQR